MTPFRAALLLALVAAPLACEQPEPPPKPIRPVRAITLGDVEAFSSRSFPGRAEATREVNLAFEVHGKLTGRPVEVGDVVSEGQVLARLDPRDFQNALDAALARQAQAEAFRDRIAQAAKTGAVAQQDLTDAQASYDVASAEVNIAQKALADTELQAPFAGTIAATFVENFQNVQAKQAILRLLDTSRIELTVDVPESLISNVQYVGEVTVAFDAFPGRPVPATIKEVGTEATLTTRTYPVTVIMDQPDDFQILPGMAGVATGEAELPGETQFVGFELPATSLFQHEGQDCVWVLVPGDDDLYTATRREVETGVLSALGVRVKGLEPGLLIATAGARSLREGQHIRLLQDDEG
jgi:RND family efflux transporter MFP subunit